MMRHLFLSVQKSILVRKLTLENNFRKTSPNLSKMDVFIGYHADMCASIILHVCHELCGEENRGSDTESVSDSEEEPEKSQNVDEKIEHLKEKV